MRTTLLRLVPLAVLVVTIGIAGGYAQRGAQLAPEDVVGRYRATRFDIHQDGRTTRLACAGGHLNVDVTADYVAGGELFFPDTLGLPPTTVNLFGPYELNGRTVAFRPEAGTFLDGMTWTWHAGGILTGEVTDGPRHYAIELQRQ